MNIVKNIIILCLLSIFLVACINDDSQKSSYNIISQTEAKEMMDTQDVIILDVRTIEEHNEKSIPNSIVIPNETIIDTPPEELGLDETILIYCRSGNRSKQAAEKLANMGYKYIYEFGGINDWQYDTVSNH